MFCCFRLHQARVAFACLSLLITLLAPNVYGQARALSQEQQPTTSQCTLNGSDGWYPVYFKDNVTGSWQGIMPDVAKALRERKGIPIEIVDRVVPWGRLFIALDEGRLGAVGGAYRTQERESKYLLSEPVSSDDIHVFVAAGKTFNFQELSDLQGKRGLRPRGSLGEQMDHYGDNVLDKIKKKRNVNVMFRMLEVDRAEYAVTSLKTGQDEMKKNPQFRSTITMLPTPVVQNGIHYVFSRTGDCYIHIDAINAGIRDLKQEGVIAEILARYP